jgi:hypothetical protein
VSEYTPGKEWVDGEGGTLIEADDLNRIEQGIEAVSDQFTTHVMDPTPHPAYDDIPDLVLLLENGMA